MKNNKWEDHYSRLAQKENFPARSVYKLKEIQNKFKIIKKGYKILDLGCSPGSWLLYAAKETGETGEVIGIDINPINIKLTQQIKVFTYNVTSIDENLFSDIGRNFNVILSDMAPLTTGNKSVDNARSFNLCISALLIAQKVLLKDGHFVCKIFQGSDFKDFVESVKLIFNQCKIFKPQSSRKESKEIYIIGLYKK